MSLCHHTRYIRTRLRAMQPHLFTDPKVVNQRIESHTLRPFADNVILDIWDYFAHVSDRSDAIINALLLDQPPHCKHPQWLAGPTRMISIDESFEVTRGIDLCYFRGWASKVMHSLASVLAVHNDGRRQLEQAPKAVGSALTRPHTVVETMETHHQGYVPQCAGKPKAVTNHAEVGMHDIVARRAAHEDIETMQLRERQASNAEL